MTSICDKVVNFFSELIRTTYYDEFTDPAVYAEILVDKIRHEGLETLLFETIGEIGSFSDIIKCLKKSNIFDDFEMDVIETVLVILALL